MDEKIKLPLFRQGEWYVSGDSKRIHPKLNGYMSIAPEIVLKNDYKWVKSLRNNLPDLFCRVEKRRILSETISIFCNGDVMIDQINQTIDDFKELLWSYNGLTYHMTEQWLKLFDSVSQKRIEEDQDHTEHCGTEVCLISLPSNTFLTLEECLNVLLSDQVLWIKVSIREPFSALRFVAALLQAGWPRERIYLYGAERGSLNTMVRLVDKSVLFGGDVIKKKFSDYRNVVVHGPGRACAFVDRGNNSPLVIEQLLERVAGNMGKFCVNVSIIACFEHIEVIQKKVAECLDAIPIIVSKNNTEDYVIAQNWYEEELMAFEKQIEENLQSGDKIITTRGITQSIDGKRFPVPVLLYVARPIDHPLLELELPYPFAVICECDEEDILSISGKSEFIYRIGTTI